MDISLRKGIKQDLPQVLALIKELADYENALDQVSVTLEPVSYTHLTLPTIYSV